MSNNRAAEATSDVHCTEPPGYSGPPPALEGAPPAEPGPARASQADPRGGGGPERSRSILGSPGRSSAVDARGGDAGWAPPLHPPAAAPGTTSAARPSPGERPPVSMTATRPPAGRPVCRPPFCRLSARPLALADRRRKRQQSPCSSRSLRLRATEADTSQVGGGGSASRKCGFLTCRRLVRN